MHSFRDTLQLKSTKITQQYEHLKHLSKCLRDPTQAVNVHEEIIEENLELLINDSELHDTVEVGLERKKHLDLMKGEASKMVEQLEEKNERMHQTHTKQFENLKQ